MASKLRRNYNPWTKRELEVLNQCFTQAIPINKAAQQAELALKRSSEACKVKYYSHFYKGVKRLKARPVIGILSSSLKSVTIVLKES